MYIISKQFFFSASHRLAGLPASHPCSRLHGHNYEVRLELSGEALDDRGFVVDFNDLKPLQEFLADNLDHRHLNEVLPVQPSAENIARFIFEWCADEFDERIAGAVSAVVVSETPKTTAEYRLK